MRLIISILLVTVGFGLDSACISTKPVHYYAMQARPRPAIQSNPNGVILLGGDIAAPEVLQDTRIRYRSGSNEVGSYEYHRWTERPGLMVRDALLRALRESGKYKHVLEAGSSVNGDYLLRGKLEEFDEVDQASIQTKISLRVELVDRKTNQNVWDYVAEREDPVSGKNVVDVVQSLDRNLQQVASDVAAKLDQFLSARR